MLALFRQAEVHKPLPSPFSHIAGWGASAATDKVNMYCIKRKNTQKYDKPDTSATDRKHWHKSKNSTTNYARYSGSHLISVLNLTHPEWTKSARCHNLILKEDKTKLHVMNPQIYFPAPHTDKRTPRPSNTILELICLHFKQFLDE